MRSQRRPWPCSELIYRSGSWEAFRDPDTYSHLATRTPQISVKKNEAFTARITTNHHPDENTIGTKENTIKRLWSAPEDFGPFGGFQLGWSSSQECHQQKAQNRFGRFVFAVFGCFWLVSYGSLCFLRWSMTCNDQWAALDFSWFFWERVERCGEYSLQRVAVWLHRGCWVWWWFVAIPNASSVPGVSKVCDAVFPATTVHHVATLGSLGWHGLVQRRHAHLETHSKSSLERKVLTRRSCTHEISFTRFYKYCLTCGDSLEGPLIPQIWIRIQSDPQERALRWGPPDRIGQWGKWQTSQLSQLSPLLFLCNGHCWFWF